MLLCGCSDPIRGLQPIHDVAFDQLYIVLDPCAPACGPMRGEANSFDNDYASYVRLLRAHGSEMPGYLYHAAYLGNWSRLDDAARNTSIICNRKTGEGTFLDNRQRLWARLTVQTLRILLGSHANCAPNPALTLGLTDYDWKILGKNSSKMPALRRSGWSAQGVKTITQARTPYDTMSPSKVTRVATVLAVRVRYRTPSIAEPCPAAIDVTDPFGSGYKSFCAGNNSQRQFVVYDRFQFKNIPDGMFLDPHTWVTERGNIRPLTARDAKLFSTPNNYTNMCASHLHKNDWAFCLGNST